MKRSDVLPALVGTAVGMAEVKNISTTCKHGRVFCAACCFATSQKEAGDC
jgi:hypothetical protein